MVYALAGLTALGVALTVIVVRREPRRSTNAVLCGGAAVLFIMTVMASGAGGGGASLAITVLVFSAPLLAIGLVLALLANGVLMVRREGRSLVHLLSGLTGLALIGAMIGSLTMVLSGHGLLAPLGVWIVLVVAWFGFLFGSMLLYQIVYQIVTGNQRPDYVVVLGAGLVRGQVGRLLANRIDAAHTQVQMWRRRGASPVLVMSGGKGDDEPRSEAAAMAEYASTTLAVPSQDIIAEQRSTTTEENLLYTAELVAADERLGPGAKGLAVTSNFHVLRTAELARRQGLDLQVAGARVAWYYWPSAVLREFVAQLVYHRVPLAITTALVTVPLPVVLGVVAAT